MANEIYTAIPKIMSELKAVGMTRYNQKQDFYFRGVYDIANALHPVFYKNGVFVVPEVLEEKRGEKPSKNGAVMTFAVLRVKYTFYASDGSSVSAVVIGEGADALDKASNKAMSAAFKYACSQVFCVPTIDIVDSDEDNDDDGRLPPYTGSRKDGSHSDKNNFTDNVAAKSKSDHRESTISEKQINRIFAITKKNEAIRIGVLKKFGYDDPAKVTVSSYQAVCSAMGKAIAELNAELIEHEVNCVIDCETENSDDVISREKREKLLEIAGGDVVFCQKCIKECGYEKSSNIKNKDYIAVCDFIAATKSQLQD